MGKLDVYLVSITILSGIRTDAAGLVLIVFASHHGAWFPS